MNNIHFDIPDIPHGHGLSFRKGVADGLLDCLDHEDTLHKTHAASYRRGIDVGVELAGKIALFVKD